MAPGGGLGIDFSPHPRPKLHQRSASELPEHHRMLTQTEAINYGFSSKAMAGLHLAETGASMVEMCKNGDKTNFREGKHIGPGSLPIEGGNSRRRRPPLGRGMSVDEGLPRHGTLLNLNGSPTHRSKELKALLGSGSSKVKSGAIVGDGQCSVSKNSADVISYEQGRSKQRVTIDMDLENNVVVEGGYISGVINMRIRPKKNDSVLHLGCGKLRIAGFEVAPGNETQHIFYQHAAPLLEVANGCKNLFRSNMDREGFGSVIEGEYSLNFSMEIPQGTSGRPRGVLRSKSGVSIRYIIIVSIKVLESSTGKRSIAHFYRDCEVWPACDPVVILAPAPEPIIAEASKNVFMGGDGIVSLKASIRRLIWIANRPLYVTVRITNDTRKAVRGVILELIRTTTIFKPRSVALAAPICSISSAAGVETDMTGTKERKIAESVLMASAKSAKGHASAKGYWSGVESGKTSTVVHSIHIPTDALSISRARLVEIDYAVRVSLCVASLTGVAEAVHVLLPIRIINFLSVDAPPSEPLPALPRQSIIELNTPKSQSAGIGGPRMHRRVEPDRICDASGQISRSLQTAYHRSQTSCSSQTSNMTDLSTCSSLSSGPQSQSRTSPEFDLGTIEDVDNLNVMLGDIPGSTSILEETDLSAYGSVSGYTSESGYESYREGQYLVDETDEDVALERMIGHASAAIGHDFSGAAYPAEPNMVSQQSSQSSISYIAASDIPSQPTTEGSKIRGPRAMTQRPKYRHTKECQQHVQRRQKVENFSDASNASRGAWEQANDGHVALHSRSDNAWLESDSEYSPPSMTLSLGNVGSSSSGVVTDGDEETTPIQSSTQEFAGRATQTRMWMKAHANGCATSRGILGSGGRMTMSNVQARVAKYEKCYREIL